MNNMIKTEPDGRKRNDYGMVITYWDGTKEEFRIISHIYLDYGVAIEFLTADDEFKHRITDKIKAIDFDKDIHKAIEADRQRRLAQQNKGDGIVRD